MQLGLLRTENLFKSSNKASNECRGQNADATPMRTSKHSATSHYAHVLMAQRCAGVQSILRVQVEHFANDFPMTVELDQIEEIRKAMPCPVVCVNTDIGARSDHVN